jgi:cytochrome c oxidase subunit I+III
LFIFTLGGLTGVMVAIVPFDWQAHDSYFIVAHLHYVLIGGMVMPVLAALYYWMPVLHGHRLSERCGRWVFGLVFGGFHVAFFPMHIAGLRGMPRRVYTYDGGLGWDAANLVSSAGAALLAAGFALLAVDVVRTLRRPHRQHDNPWHAPTLEWLPTREYGTRSIPQVESREPLWRRPGLAGEVREGRHWLPGTATGLRETLVTTALRAELSHLIVLPGPSWLPFIGALGTAAFFLLLTVKWVVPAFAFGALAVVCVVAWLWQTDRLPSPVARVADGVRLPVGAALAASPSWWATLVLVVVDLIVLASMAFGHVHLAMRLAVCPPPGAALPAFGAVLAAAGAFTASGAAMAWGGRGLGSTGLSRWRVLWIGVAAAALAAGFGLLMAAAGASGLNPRADGWSATVASLIAYVGLHVALLALCAAYLGARVWRGLVTPRQRATFDNVALLWWCGCVQGVVVALLPHVVAGAMG